MFFLPVLPVKEDNRAKLPFGSRGPFLFIVFIHGFLPALLTQEVSHLLQFTHDLPLYLGLLIGRTLFSVILSFPFPIVICRFP